MNTFSNNSYQCYFDNAATTRVRDEVAEKIVDVLKNNYGNPSSTHSYGRPSKSLIELSRKEIAAHLNVSASEIIFTSGGTEADNLILRSAARDLKIRHFISSKIEHHAVTHTLDELEKDYNVKVSFVNLNKNGEVDYKNLNELLANSKDRCMVSLMHINNEIGNMLDLEKVSNICLEHKALFHSDTVQSVGHYNIDLSKTKVDFIVASAHKFHGPKGIGFAYINKSSQLRPLIFGGMQERGYRAGTESVHNIVGMSEALNISMEKLEEEKKYISELKSYFIKKLKSSINDVEFNGLSGDMNKSTYTLLNVQFPIEQSKAEMFLFKLDLKGIACSKGSACQSGSDVGSHVLNEVLSSEELNKVSIRFSLSIYNKKEDIDIAVNEIVDLLS
ncbi:MAG: cysteine desulfurase family protein [Bacteroidota bacterium]|nr:cysteine desulfurase family protein [Bacteroidota bacterium]|tara:strand:+ start:172 stop:1338 length:1167 start_codon:yes stop_codon:yes gene_type:complete